MNKKFSTLVASLLLTSAFSVYSVDAKPMLATPTQVETRAAAADVEEAVEWTGSTLTIPTAIQNNVLDGFTNNARIATVNGTTAGSYLGGIPNNQNFGIGTYPTNVSDAQYYYWSFVNGNLINNIGQTFAISSDRDYLEIIPLTVGNEDSPYFVMGQRDENGRIYYLYWQTAPTGTFILVPALSDATVFASVETAYSTAAIGTQVNDVLGGAFNLYISSLKDENAEITNAEAFGGDLTAMDNASTEATSANNYYIKNAAGKYIVFDSKDETTSDGYSEKGKFKLVDFADVANYDCYKFQIKFADNGSEAVQVTTGSTTLQYRLYIANVNDTYGLSVADMWSGRPIPAANWAVTSFDQGNLVNLREFLTGQFYTVDFVESESTTDEYKDGGRLAIRENGSTDYADYVDASSLYSKAPEAQWAVSSGYDTYGNPYYDGTIVLTNRENPSIWVTISKMRRIKDKGLEVVGVTNMSRIVPAGAGVAEGDIIKLTAVTDHKKNDGYAVFSDNDLKNETYHLGQLRQTADGDINVYWAENHNASHQIGATVDSLKATRWNLSLVKKANAGNDYVGQTDSVLVVSELQEWNSVKNRIDVKQDTLVILPYAFQNRSNSEFAEFNDGTNLDYYQCNVYNQGEKKVYKYGEDAMFALKRKADVDGQPVYNYVMLNAKEASDYTKGAVKAISTAYAAEKVYQENSTDRGTWKNMQMYAGDANALMFVNKVYAPEYRKLVADAALDTITIYRGDNEHQVVYEKKNKDAVVNGDTLSFLNVDNDVQFTNINPALYADSAYVNRGDNTRWQYLLAVNVEHVEGYYCPDHGFRPEDTCEHSKWVSYNKGRYLINMIDTANIYGKTAGIHNNPYINETEEGNQCAKLSFVDAIHVLADGVDPEMADKLYVINGTEKGDTSVIDLGSDALNVAKFAFKYTDSMESDEFKIQTQWKDYNPTAYGTNAYAAPTENGYLRWVNGCIVVDNGYEKGDVFNMNEDETRTPTANEEISAEEATVSVVATDGAVIVKGAEGKNVIVSTILGKIVANEVVNSDNETIAAPAGIVVVSVDGESFKVAVK